MQSLKKHAGALILIAVLVLLKWVVVPIFEWQQATLVSNNALAVRLAKSDSAMNNQSQLQEKLAVQAQRIEQAQQLLFATQASNNFQLAQQKNIERLFAKYNIQISQLSWQIALPLNDIALIEHQVNLRFSGEFTRVAKLMGEINAQQKWYNLDDFQLRFDRRRGQRLGEVDGRMDIKMYMRAPS